MLLAGQVDFVKCTSHDRIHTFWWGV